MTSRPLKSPASGFDTAPALNVIQSYTRYVLMRHVLLINISLLVVLSLSSSPLTFLSSFSPLDNLFSIFLSFYFLPPFFLSQLFIFTVHDFYFYVLSWAGHVARMEEGRSAFKIITGKPTGKRPLGRLRRRWEDNIRMDLEEIGINAGIGLIRLRIGIIGEPL